MNKSLLSTILIVLAIILPTKSWAQEPYAVLSDNNTVLTFYYDDQKSARNGMSVGPFIIDYEITWNNAHSTITSVVFDTSFANCTILTSTAYWFCNCEYLTTITGIENLNTANVTDMSYMFYSCSSLISLDVSHFNTENVTNMSMMFYKCSSLTSLDLSHFNTGNVTDMRNMFSMCSSLITLDVSHFNTSNVTNMSQMFMICPSLTSLNVSNFNTANVTDMSGMFQSCASLTSLDLSNFITDKVTNMNEMFGECSNLTSLSISNFNTENVINMSVMFSSCKSLTNLDLSVFNTANVTDMAAMFMGSNGLTTIYVGEGWSIAKVTSGSGMFYDCNKLVGGAGTHYDKNHTDHIYAHIDGGTANPGYFTRSGDEPWVDPSEPEPYAVLSNNNTVLTFYYDEKKAERNGMSVGPFEHTGLREENWNTYSSIITNIVFDDSFANCTTLTSTAFWFSGFNNLKTIDGISNLKTDNVTEMTAMFIECFSLPSIDVSNFNTANVTNMSEMFALCSSLTALDLSQFNTTKVTDMSGMFNRCSSLSTLNLSQFNTTNVTDMGHLFSSCEALTTLDVSGFNTEHVTSMSGMFERCPLLTSLDVSNFNTAAVTTMRNMFEFCSSLTTIYVGNEWNTANVSEGNDMFHYCTNIVGGKGTKYDPNHTDAAYAHIDGGTANPGYFTRSGDEPWVDPTDPEPYAVLSDNNTVLTFYYDEKKAERNGMDVGPFESLESRGWNNVSNIITTVIFDQSFANCTTLTSTADWFNGLGNLTTITDMSNLKTDNVTNMDSMFNGCSGLTSLDLTGFKTDNVTRINSMFRGCSSLTSLDLSGFKTDNVTELDAIFYMCSNLKSIDLSNFKTDNVTSMILLFSSCSSLTSLDLSSFKTDNVTEMTYMFSGCSNLKTIYVSDKWSTANITDGVSMFGSCARLVGGAGTVYDENHIDHTYAHIDGGENDPGYLTSKNASAPADDIIQFEDPVVKEICVANWDTNRDGELSYNEAAAVNDLGQVFYNNHNITSFNELQYFTGLTEIGNTAFFNCSLLSSVTIPNSVVSITGQAFSYCDALTTITIPNSVTTIGNAFMDSKNITSVELPNSLVTIGQMAFSGCESLSSITIPSSVTTIGDYAFQGCYSLNSISIPYSVNSITGSTFHLCKGLVSINVDENNTNYTSQDGVLFTKDMTTIIRYPTGKSNKSYTIPNSVTTIEESAFTACNNLTDIIIPNSVVVIGWSSFNRCEAITSVIFPNSLNRIGMYSFANCINLTSITIPSDVTSIGEEAFDGCTSLKSITFNKCIRDMGDLIIGDCTNLENVIILDKNPTTIAERVFWLDWDGTMTSATLYVPYGTKTLYETTSSWNLFQNIVEMDRIEGARFDGLTAWVSGDVPLEEAFMEVEGGREAASQTIAAIVWENSYALTADMLQDISNPNLLVYVNEPSLAPQGIQNVVVNGQAQEIVLTDAATGNNNWYCPQAFTAEKISYTRNFSQQTEVGVSRGWESIALPFTVQEITHESKGQITPFGANGTKHFWLRGYSPDGLYSAATLEANKPYVISMPNNTVVYPDAHNLNGRVTFSASNTTVPATPPLEEMMVVRDNIIMMPTFQYIPQNEYIYAVNVGQARDRYAEGSVFARDLRDVRPFEAYTTHGERNGARPNFIRIAAQPSNESVGIRDIKTDSAESAWYSIDGRKLQGEPQRKGVYIQKGKKIRVK